ncbi:MFS transporter [Aquisalimonas lutea]|uniref:MFS transporter n=1 Tax=Aquisalimonas lutea TaxID=1327750 RepID=UPI0025B3AA11|nr:MFS transporter [Aquisalimonas lutea]MDN3519663.1 MFS transporter [Aquisalimonas lutea]
MLPTLASLAALLASVGILLLGGGLLGTLLSVRLGVEGVSATTVGLVMACYSVGFVLGTLFCDRIIQKVGHIRVFAALAAVAACAALIHGLHVDPWLWAGMRIMFGFAIAGLYMVAESWLNDRTPREVRGRVLGVYVVVTSAALGLGQFALGLGDVSSHELFSVAAMLLAAALIPVALARVPSPELRSTGRVSLRQLYRISPLATVTAFGAGGTNGGFFALGPVFAVEAGFSAGEVGTFMGAAVLGGLFLQYLIGRLSDHFDRRRVIMVVALIVAFASLALVFLRDQPLWTVIVLVVFWGGANFTLYALGLAMAHDFMAPDERVPASATLLLVHGLGMIAGPVVLSRVMEWTGAHGLFLGFAVVAVLVAAFGWYRNRVGVSIEVEAQERYRAAPQATHSTQYWTGLDPESEDAQLEFDFEMPDEQEEGAHG